ncbi:serine protease, S1-C subfamily, contains C-terminal PDZ domain [Amycolatopsis arida]|uniref:Serine protease, S1-C subfamily, contains C-terminal PDZ domain n=1 Tax=Amycolatopsis arida TaxID=587909 RepID=A0A1I5YWB0_9PSEU|nr:trypsin-like peptidase domain-containing protein [Amycolatopsis arida]TDX89939.1 S1-C subfamily serine protease [Amycolatopsis arida]SFQ48553.1 serine protease, S1-C subfamily, contains C-terminal PDZ domain [Amycolatopsis arida]
MALSRTPQWIVALAATALVAAGCSGDPAPEPAAKATTTAPAPAPGDAAGYAGVVERVAPSVVTVRTPGAGVGSGVVLRPDVVVTNAHVVGDQRRVTLVFADGTEAQGEVLATDRVTDLAVVRSARGNLPVPEFRTDLPRPGDLALAIGSPLGFENSVTAGVISGLHREIPGSAPRTQSLVDLIQTDASISPGNSGGTLLDAQGRVVGVNEAYIPPEAGAVSLGFAIPAATVLDTTEQLLADGKATHPYLGVSLSPLTPPIREQFGIEAEDGALVAGVDADGPAAHADIRAGDVITRFADREIGSVEDVLAALRSVEPNQQVPLTVMRDGTEQKVTVEVAGRTG